MKTIRHILPCAALGVAIVGLAAPGVEPSVALAKPTHGQPSAATHGRPATGGSAAAPVTGASAATTVTGVTLALVACYQPLRPGTANLAARARRRSRCRGGICPPARP
jgi:hypothetical protein